MNKKIFNITIGKVYEKWPLKTFESCKDCIVVSCCSTLCEEGAKEAIKSLRSHFEFIQKEKPFNYGLGSDLEKILGGIDSYNNKKDE